MEELIQSIQDQLEAKVKELQYIDEDWGQMDYDLPPVKYPCALVDIQSGTFTNDGELRQKGIITIAVKLYHLRLNNSSNNAPQNQKDENKTRWQIYRKVNQALHGQDSLPDGFSTPIRISMKRVIRTDGICEQHIFYTVSHNDNSCVPVRKSTPAQPVITSRVKSAGVDYEQISENLIVHK